MSGFEYAQAHVVLFDPIRVNMRTTRYALQQIGFKDIASTSNIVELQNTVADVSPHLLIIETADNEDEAFNLVRKIRSGDISQNPFMSILLTGWKRDADIIRSAIGSGADDIMMRPFSTTFAEDRIKTLIKARKPFIVTSDYTGPDRRRDPTRKSGIKPIEAPNLLKAVVEGDPEEVMCTLALIEQVQSSVESERLKRLCMRVIIGAEAALSEIKAGRYPNVDSDEFERTSVLIRTLLARNKSTQATRLAQAMCESAVTLGKPQGLTEANLGQIKEMSMAVYSAYSGDNGLERSQEEIAKAAQVLSKRMASAKKTVESKQQSDAGAEDEAELKRAAG